VRGKRAATRRANAEQAAVWQAAREARGRSKETLESKRSA
jgi:hypothetical protein